MNSLNPGVALHSPFERYRAGILSARRAVNVCLLALLMFASVPAANADDFAFRVDGDNLILE